MDLLDVARGPVLKVALAVFVLGTLWRLFGILRLPRRPDRSPAREGAPGRARGALLAVARGFWPRQAFAQVAVLATINSWIFHLALALVCLGYAPHIAFIRRITGLGWPALPDAVMHLAAGAAFVALPLALWLRLSDPVRRYLSRTDDYLSWAVTFLPFLTGMAVMSDPSAALLARPHAIYRDPLAWHLITLELLLLWFPFGKLMHAVLFAFSRGATGLRFSHRGVRV